jgi:hypothetical protein
MVSHGVAFTSADVPFARLSADETRIFVMRDGPGWCEAQVSYPRLSNGERVDFIRDFPCSGVYTLSDRKLVYGVDWFSLDREVIVSNDLSHIARLNQFGSFWALKFYTNGKVTKTYTCDQLLKAFSSEQFLQYTTIDWHYQWHEDYLLKGQKVFLTTASRRVFDVPIFYHEEYLFDLTTGAIERADVLTPAFVAVAAGWSACLLLLGTSIVITLRKRRNRQTRKFDLKTKVTLTLRIVLVGLLLSILGLPAYQDWSRYEKVRAECNSIKFVANEMDLADRNRLKLITDSWQLRSEGGVSVDDKDEFQRLGCSADVAGLIRYWSTPIPPFTFANQERNKLWIARANARLQNFELRTRYSYTNDMLFVANERYAVLYENRQGELWHTSYTPQKAIEPRKTGQRATKPAEKPPTKDQPSTTTPKDQPR